MMPDPKDDDDLEEFWEAVRRGGNELEDYWASIQLRGKRPKVTDGPPLTRTDLHTLDPDPDPPRVVDRDPQVVDRFREALEEGAQQLDAPVVVQQGRTPNRRTRRPWDEGAWQLPDRVIAEQWLHAQPGEFGFAVAERGDESYIAITPLGFLSRTSSLWDQSLRIDDLLPAGIGEESEGTYTFDPAAVGVRGGDWPQACRLVRAALELAGFVHSATLQSMLA
jgi:hypothetical protein